MRPFRYEDLVGKPYTEGGRGPEGYDCWGIVMECLRRQAIRVPDPFARQDQLRVKLDQRAADATDWIASLFGDWRRTEEQVIGSVLAFRDQDGDAVHVGVLVEPKRFVHACKRTGVALVRLERPPWPEHLLGMYTYHGRG